MVYGKLTNSKVFKSDPLCLNDFKSNLLLQLLSEMKHKRSLVVKNARVMWLEQQVGNQELNTCPKFTIEVIMEARRQYKTLVEEMEEDLNKLDKMDEDMRIHL